MKKIILLIGIVALLLAFSSCEKDFIEEPIDNTELKSAKTDKVTGFNEWGYNWNAHHFNGILMNAIIGDNLYNGAFFGDWEPYLGDDETYINNHPGIQVTPEFYLPGANELPFWLFRNVKLVMHWNESLISREGVYPVPLDNWIDTDAWITFHYSGIDENGKRWSQFQKMVSREPTDKHGELITDLFGNKSGIWYNEQDEQIGVYNNWEQLIMIQVVNTGNVPTELGFFAPYKSPEKQGLGTNK